MTVFMKQAKQIMITCCHLLLNQKRYSVAANMIGFGFYDWKRKGSIIYIMLSMTYTMTLGRSKKKNSHIVGTKKNCRDCFNQNIDNIK